jgi:hypothetical protein
MTNDNPHENALVRHWTVDEGRTSNPRVGSWVDIYEVLDKVGNDEPLTRLERRVLKAHLKREAKRREEK